MSRVAGCLIATCAWLVACGPPAGSTGDDDGADAGPTGPHELSFIEITPTNALVELDLGEASAMTFSVTGHYQDGASEDVTHDVSWTVENPAIGALTNERLDIAARAMTGVDVGLVHVQLQEHQARAQVTVVAYRKTGANPDFFFVLPYQDPMGPTAKPLEFGTAVPSMDVFMLTDITGSMGEEIAALKTALSSTIVPGIKAIIPDTYFGAAAFQDFPIGAYGIASDQPLRVYQTITDDVAAVQAGINQYAIVSNSGNDIAESGIEAIYQLITGEGISSPSPTSVAAFDPGFRPTAMPVVVATTDAFMHEPGGTKSCTFFLGFPFNQFITQTTAYDATVPSAHNRAQAKTALANKCARVVGVSTDSGRPTCSGQSDLEEFSTATGARVPPAAWDVGTRPAGCASDLCCTGIDGVGRAPDGDGLCPLVFLTNTAGNGLGSNIVTGIQMLARFAQFDVTSDKSGPATDVNGVALPAAHTTADFIKAVVPNGFVLPAAPPVVPPPTKDAVAFYGVTPATRVTFDITALNDFVPQTPEAQIFRATVRVLASGCTPLDQREVLILVPPQPLSIQ